MATSAGNQGSLTVEDGMDLVIVLLYAPGRTGNENEPIDGITRFQKLTFLLQHGVGPKQLVDEAKAYGYKPYKLGPYSSELQQDLEELKSAGIVTTRRLDYWLTDDSDEPGDVDPDMDVPSWRAKRVESDRFSLSADLGLRVGKELWSSLRSKERQALAEFKAFFNSLSLRQLLIFTYESYPKYATQSEIKEKLGLF